MPAEVEVEPATDKIDKGGQRFSMHPCSRPRRVERNSATEKRYVSRVGSSIVLCRSVLRLYYAVAVVEVACDREKLVRGESFWEDPLCAESGPGGEYPSTDCILYSNEPGEIEH